jgi:hypothetical protein
MRIHLDGLAMEQPGEGQSFNATRQGDLPYSLDLPLQPGGLRLALYGPEDSSFPPSTKGPPVVVHVPLGSFLLWRGDMIHGGGMWDFMRSNGFRMHAYLPLNKDHYGLVYTHTPEIEWHSRGGPRLANFYLDPYGRDFI